MEGFTSSLRIRYGNGKSFQFTCAKMFFVQALSKRLKANGNVRQLGGRLSCSAIEPGASIAWPVKGDSGTSS